jgi:hypothetical protein
LGTGWWKASKVAIIASAIPARESIAAQRICAIPFPDSSTNPTRVGRDLTEVERLAQQLWSSSLLETVVKRESADEMGEDFTLPEFSANTSRTGLRVVPLLTRAEPVYESFLSLSGIE